MGPAWYNPPTSVSDDFVSLDPHQLARYLERRKAHYSFEAEIDLDNFFREILAKARQFVPAEAGSILLDDPMTKGGERDRNELVFAAAFGDRARDIVGQRIPAAVGLVGHVYQSGEPYLGRTIDEDPFFFPGLDELTSYQSRSIICVPIRIEKSICGALELVNRQGSEPFTDKDLELMAIFADYTSMSIRHVLDARRAHEIAKRDDLTGLFNDRFFHLQLTVELLNAGRTDRDLSLIFFDLDNFKTVNDSHGHLAGSQVLREVGYLLKKTVTFPDVVLSRYGGDEFVAILPGASLEDGVAVGECIRRAIQDATFLEREYGFSEPALYLRGVITCSLGAASRKRHVDPDLHIDQQKNAILRRADAAMYKAKGSGKNKVLAAE